MNKIVYIVKNKVCSIAKAIFLCVIKHNLSLQLCIYVCGILLCSVLFFLWYRVPHRTVNYNIKTLGCIGEPKCKIYAKMNYGYKNIPKDSLGYSIEILHPFKENPPYLFKGNVFGTDIARTKKYFEEYEQLTHQYPDAIDSISTLYKSVITQEANFYDKIKNRDSENWVNSKGTIIYKYPTRIKSKTVCENETWFYLKRKMFIDTIPLSHKLHTSFERPKWFSKGDISKLDFELKFNLYNLMECEEINIHFNGPYSLYSIDIEPDKKKYDHISYTNPFKLEIIHKKGLRLCASFPIFERMQQTRITAILIIIPFLLSRLPHILKEIMITQRESANQNNLNK